MSKIFNIILAVGLFGLCGFLFLVESLELPSRTGADSSIYEPPVTYLMAIFPLAFGTSLVLHEVDRVKYKKLINIIVATGVIVLFVGVVIVASLLKL